MATMQARLADFITAVGADYKALKANPLTGWYDVTKQPTPYKPANTAALNVTNINLIMSAAPANSTLYIPGGTYDNNAAWTMPASKNFIFEGQMGEVSGGATIMQWSSVVGATWITLPASTWYWEFNNIAFVSSVVQTAGGVINVNGNVGTNFSNCTFGGIGSGFLNDVLLGEGGNGSNSWNSAVIDRCFIGEFKGRGIRVSSSGSSLVVSNSVIQGNWGGFAGTPASAAAVAGISGGFVGCVQLIGCDLLGSVNNVLLNPVLASSEVCASFFATNTFMDNSAGSCVLVTGTGATVRCNFTQCTMTTAGSNYTTVGTNLSGIEINSTYSYPVGGQNLSFDSCNVHNTFGTTGACNGVKISGNWADVYFNNCKVSGWGGGAGCGYTVTPMAGNISNLRVIGGACGPSGGYGANGTGFNIVGGAYKGLTIEQVNTRGNTTNLLLGVVTCLAGEYDMFRIIGNPGINPKPTAALTPTYPATTVAVVNTTGYRVQVLHKITTATTTALTINGIACVFPAVAGLISYTLEPGGTVAVAYTGTAGTWTWLGQ